MMKQNFVICTFYTPGYIQFLSAWENRVKATGYEYHIELMEDRGKWSLNDCIKPEFIKSMMLKYPDKNIVWVDIDGQIVKKPVLFESIGNDIDMAGHRLILAPYEWKYIQEKYTYQKMWGSRLVLGGTLMLGNTDRAHRLVDMWMESCQNDPDRQTGDQDNLNELLDKHAEGMELNFYELPYQYVYLNPSRDQITYEGYGKKDSAVILHNYTSPIMRRLDELKKKGKVN